MVPEMIPVVKRLLRTHATGVAPTASVALGSKMSADTFSTAWPDSRLASKDLPVNSPTREPAMLEPEGAANTTPATFEAEAAEEWASNLSLRVTPVIDGA